MNRKILLVEDEALIALAESRTLESHQFESVIATSGEEAIKLLKDDPGIDLVLMDIDLGRGMDGTEAAQNILQSRNLPIVFLTSHTEKEIVDKVKGISRYGYVLKNSGEFVLVESINMAFELFHAHTVMQERIEELSAVYQHGSAAVVLLNSDLTVQEVHNGTSESIEPSSENLLKSRLGESLRCLNHLRSPQGCGYGPDCRKCAVRTTVLSTFSTQRPHTRVPVSIPVRQNGTESSISFFISTIYLPQKSEPTVMVIVEKLVETSSRKYRSLFNSIRDAILVADTSRKIIDCNPAFSDLFGYSLDEIRGKPTYAVYNDMHEFHGMGQALQEHTENLSDFIFTVHYRKKDGTVFSGETNVFYLRNEADQIVGFIGLIRDITERLHMEAELRESEENLRLTLNSIGDAVFSTDLTGRVIRMNPVAEQLTGWERSAAEGKPIDEVFHIVDTLNGKSIESPVKQVLESGTIVGLSNHTKLISRTGEEYQIADSAAPITDDEGRVRGSVMVFRDVSREYAQEQKLRESEEKYRSLVDNAPIGIFQTTSKGQPLQANSTMARMLGAESSEEGIAKYQDLAHRLYVNPQRRVELITALKEKKHVENFEYQARTLQNEHIWISMTARVSAEMDDGTFIIDGFAFDITEQKRTRDAIRQALEEKQNLILEMNHRVKNNLALVASLINLQESSGERNIDLSGVVNQIHAIKMIHEQLYSSEDATHTRLKTYLLDIVQSVFSSMSSQPVKIDSRIEDIVVASRVAVPLGLITNEIATNTVKYGLPGPESEGTFHISLEHSPEQANELVYTLSNNGPPFPDEFDPETTDTLGMQLIVTLVDQLDGSLHLYKRPHPAFEIRFSS